MAQSLNGQGYFGQAHRSFVHFVVYPWVKQQPMGSCFQTAEKIGCYVVENWTQKIVCDDLVITKFSYSVVCRGLRFSGNR
jgi:hypothetical protein